VKIMITGGGTGGHTSPALAVIEELRNRDPRLLLQWVGKKGSIEERVARREGIPFRALPMEGWTRKISLSMIRMGIKLCYSIIRVWMYIRVFQPDAVFGVGGYVSLPALWVAQRMGIPTFSHEQNKRLGLANRMCAHKLTTLFLSYEDTLGIPEDTTQKLTGNPVRSAFYGSTDPSEARRRLGLREDIPVILIVGGSQGARRLNEAMKDLVQRCEKDQFQFIWSTGPADVDQYRNLAENAPCTVQVYPYIEDMALVCAAADLMVSRAGASTTSELAILGKPAILVPYPHATDNHQEHNARAFEKAGAARVLLDEDCDSASLGALLKEILDEEGMLSAMGKAALSLSKPAAADDIVESILESACLPADTVSEVIAD
jgi:UDP-N-acetylglucosamine--N-acetylmuramyl-(pentapeptide) pyrophosphoryl-undecaprenol N-acetylglucosamine transferase